MNSLRRIKNYKAQEQIKLIKNQKYNFWTLTTNLLTDLNNQKYNFWTLNTNLLTDSNKGLAF